MPPKLDRPLRPSARQSGITEVWYTVRNLDDPWIENKVKSAIAEAPARAHLEAMRYAVEPFGIEHLMSDAALKRATSKRHGPHLDASFLKLLQKMPDFLATRTSEDEEQILLVEAKFRSSVTLRNSAKPCSNEDCMDGAGLAEPCRHEATFHLFCPDNKKWDYCLACEYELIITFGQKTGAKPPGNVMFYLVARKATLNGKNINNRIFVNFAHQPHWHGGSSDLGTPPQKNRSLFPIIDTSEKTRFRAVGRTIEKTLSEIFDKASEKAQ